MNLIQSPILKKTAGRAAPFLAGSAFLLLAASIVVSPESSFEASLQGLKLWWTIVFPALLPFLMLTEMLAASGFLHGLGVLLEPFMRRVFRLPGASGWVLAAGMTAGFPAGAAGAARLHGQGAATSAEAARLGAIAHFASPVTVVVVFGAALLHRPSAGYALLAAHWLGGLLAGVLAARFSRPAAAAEAPKPAAEQPAGGPLRRALAAAEAARAEDGRSFGRLLGETVASAVQQLMATGGLMIIFAVIVHVVSQAFGGRSADPAAALLELHLGAGRLAGHGPASLAGLILLAAALGWSGLCAQLQALAALKSSGQAALRFAAHRLLHAGLSALLLPAFLFISQKLQARESAEVFAPLPAGGPHTLPSIWMSLPQLLMLQFALVTLLSLLSAFMYVRHRRRRPR